MDTFSQLCNDQNTLSSSEEVKRRGTVVMKVHTGTPMTARPMDDEDKKVSVDMEKMLKYVSSVGPGSPLLPLKLVS